MGERYRRSLSFLLLVIITASAFIFQQSGRAETGTDGEVDLFIGISPGSRTWINESHVTVRMKVNISILDMDGYDFYYAFQTNGTFTGTPVWKSAANHEVNGTNVDLLIDVTLRNGTGNWIIFYENSSDPNGTISPAYNLWHDGQVPFVEYQGNIPDEWLLLTNQSLRFYIHDTLSGIDRDKVEYRVTTQGLTKWSPWKKYNGSWYEEKHTFWLKLTFRRGDQNYVQMRAWDIVGNGPTASEIVNVKVNTYPIINISSPIRGDTLYSDEVIIFDASGSYDPDGDRINIIWIISTGEKNEILGEVPIVKKTLDPGEYTITVVCKDRVINEVQYHFIITVLPEDNGEIDRWSIDSDLDGIVDGWEELWFFDPFDPTDASEDPDGDLLTNFQEYQNGTNPWEGSIPPRPPPNDNDDDRTLGPWPWTLIVVLSIILLVLLILNVVFSVRNRKRALTAEE